MKFSGYIIGGLIGVLLFVSGCSHRAAVDTAAMEEQFKEVEASIKAKADKAVATVKSGDFQNALTQLQDLTKEAKLSPGQRQVVQDVMDHVQKALGEATSKAGSELNKAGNDLQK